MRETAGVVTLGEKADGAYIAKGSTKTIVLSGRRRDRQKGRGLIVKLREARANQSFGILGGASGETKPRLLVHF